MKKSLNVFLLVIILFFFTGCASMLEIIEEIPARFADKTSAKAPENTEVFSSSFYREKELVYKKNDEARKNAI